jgi:hypothetical protein
MGEPLTAREFFALTDTLTTPYIPELHDDEDQDVTADEEGDR